MKRKIKKRGIQSRTSNSLEALKIPMFSKFKIKNYREFFIYKNIKTVQLFGKNSSGM